MWKIILFLIATAAHGQMLQAINNDVVHTSAPIALDASASGTVTGTSPSVWSHINAGNLMWVFIFGDGVSGDCCTCTYDSQSMTQVVVGGGSPVPIQVPGDRYIYAFYLAAPHTGTHNVSCSFTADAVGGLSASFTNAKQTGIPDNAAGTSCNPCILSNTSSLTTVADNSWVLKFEKNAGGVAETAGTNATSLIGLTGDSSVGLFYATSSPVTPAGATSIQTVYGGVSSPPAAQIMVSFAPL